MGQIATIANQTGQSIQWFAPPLSSRLNALLDSRTSYRDLPVIGPRTAAELQAFVECAAPPKPATDDVENMISRLALVTKDGRVSKEEARERQKLYWRGLRNVPLPALHHAFDRLLQTATFFPTVAEIIAATAGSPANAFSARRLVAQTLLMKHRKEWPAPVEDRCSPHEAREIIEQVLGKGFGGGVA